MTLPPPIDWKAAGLGIGAEVPEDRRVTGDNWRTYPFSRWAFQHTRDLVPCRPLKGLGAARALAERPARIASIRFADEHGETISWDDFVERTYTDAMLVLHRGAVVYETYRNGMTPATPHHMFSVTKSLIGLVAEILIAKGRIDPFAPTTALLPELAATAFERTHLRHLLDMVDGVAFDEDYANLDSDVHRYSASYWTPALASGGTLAALARLTQSATAPGAGFRYRTPIADAAGWMLRRATGKSLTELVEDLVWRPAGCGDAAHFVLDTGGHEIAGSGLNATVRDLARLVLMLLEVGAATLPRRVRDDIMAGGDRALFAANDTLARPGFSYRSFWWVNHNAPQNLSAAGVFGQRVHIEPENELAVIRTGSHPVASNMATEELHRNALAALREALLR